MMFAAIAALLLVMAAICLLTRKRRPAPAALMERRSAHAAQPPGPFTAEPDRGHARVPAPERPLPPDLVGFRLNRADELGADGRRAILAAFKDVPRPPKLLHHLLSADFFDSASSAELADLIAGEPLIAAKVLRTVNSTFYALKSPVQSIEKAVNHLGLMAVRSICIQYLLIATPEPDGPERKKVLGLTWRASALASELLQRLSAKLELPDQGALATSVVLSFLGRLATASTVPRSVLAKIPQQSYLDRCKAEQSAIGLSSPEVGRLLMQHWELPERIAADAAEVGCVLPSPNAGLDPVHENRMALCYLCARVSERLVDGTLPNLLNLDFKAEADADFHRLQGNLNDALMEQVSGMLRSAEINAAVSRMLRATRSIA